MKTLIGQLPDWLKDIQPQPYPPTALFNKVDCIRLYVADLESGLAFYRDRLGHPLIWRTGQAAGLHMPGTAAEIVIQTEQAAQEVDLTVGSADAAAQRFAAAGGAVLVPPLISRSAAAAWCATRGATSWCSWIQARACLSQIMRKYHRDENS